MLYIPGAGTSFCSVSDFYDMMIDFVEVKLLKSLVKKPDKAAERY